MTQVAIEKLCGYGCSKQPHFTQHHGLQEMTVKGGNRTCSPAFYTLCVAEEVNDICRIQHLLNDNLS